MTRYGVGRATAWITRALPALTLVFGLRAAGAGPGRAAGAQRQAALREAGPRRPRLHERVQRHVLRREDGRHRAHSPRRPDGHWRRRPSESDARAVGPDSEGREPQSRSKVEHHPGDASLRAVRFRLARRGHSGRRRLQDRGIPRPTSAGQSRRPRGTQPRILAVAVLGAHLPDGRQAGHLPALSGGPDHVPSAREEAPAVRGALHVRSPRPRGLRRGPPGRRGEDPRAAPEDPERHVTIRCLSGELQLLDGRNLAQNGWYVVRTPLATKRIHRQGRRVVGRAAHDLELDENARHRILAGGLPPLTAETRRHGAGHE